MKTSVPALTVVVCLCAGTSWGAERRLGESGLAQIRALEQEKASRTPAQRKIESRLLFALYKQRADPRIAAVPQLRTIPTDGRMLVDIDLTAPGGLKRVMRQLRTIGAKVASHSARFKSVRALVPLVELEALAALSDVRRIVIARRPLLHKV